MPTAVKGQWKAIFKKKAPARASLTSRRSAPEGGSLPRWIDLGRGKHAAVLYDAADRERIRLSSMSTGRFALLILLVAAAFTAYVGHVHATQEVLAEVQVLRRQNLRLHLKHNRLTGEFDRMTGPAAVYRRAQQLGLEEGFTYGPTIRIEQ